MPSLTDDELLSGLSAKEVESLLQADDNLDFLPPSFQQRDHTTKAPTGKYDPESLQKFLEEQALQIEDREDFVPFIPGKKRGKVFQKSEDIKTG